MTNYAEVIREMWRANVTLQGFIVSADDETNELFDEGVEGFKEPQNDPRRYAIIDDFGDAQSGRGSQKYRQAKWGYQIRIFAESRNIVGQIVAALKTELQTNLRGKEIDDGFACDYTLDSQQFQRAGGGLRMWQAQLSITSACRTI